MKELYPIDVKAYKELVDWYENSKKFMPTMEMLSVYSNGKVSLWFVNPKTKEHNIEVVIGYIEDKNIFNFMETKKENYE